MEPTTRITAPVQLASQNAHSVLRRSGACIPQSGIPVFRSGPSRPPIRLVSSNRLGINEWGDQLVIALYVLLQGIVGIILGAIFALGEEIGWRGFLVPQLYKSRGFTKTSLIVGLIWGIWHLPVLLFADYNSGTPAWYAMSCFMVLVVGISFVYTWFRMKSGSLSLPLASQCIFGPNGRN